MSAAQPLVFYDIASAPPLRTFAPNPWKTRLALNLKGLPYRTEWISMPDIPAARQRLNLPATRTLPDGTPYHTLPALHDPTTATLLGDSFEIALYLDRAYPARPALFRPLTAGLTAAFNAHVDGLFTRHAALCSAMPIDPRIEAEVQAIFARRAGAASWADLQLGAAQRESLLASFEAALGELAKAYRHTGGTTDYVWRARGTDEKQAQRAPEGRAEGAPFLDGEAPVYADLIVGAWLKMMEASLPGEEWAQVRTWQGGMWGRLVEVLDAWAEIK